MSQADGTPAHPSSILKADSRSEQQAQRPPMAPQMDSLSASPKSSTPKSPVSEMISPLMLGQQKSVEDFSLELARRSRRPSTKGPNALRLVGRPGSISSPKLKPAHASSLSLEFKDGPATEDALGQVENLIDQITSWMNEEKLKRASSALSPDDQTHRPRDFATPVSGRLTTDSDSGNKSYSASTPDFEKLAGILKTGRNFLRSHGRKTSVVSIRRRPSTRSLKSKASGSDTETIDNDLLVPSSDVVLDNSRTLNYTGGAASDSEESEDETQRRASVRDIDAWAKFKFEIIRLIHTLGLKGWRKVPLDSSGRITVQRLSGALTNAVYVVGPPRDWKPTVPGSEQIGQVQSTKPPPKLLLRIYGPQVEHLIDRESELAILRRLARKRIGPRMLGTFANGRFEEFFNAQTLTFDDLRVPDTSKQIAKRMRELHDGVELLEQERRDGPFVWRNWDKWVQRVEQVVSWLDAQIEALSPDTKPSGLETWKRRGFTCGVPWKKFRSTVEKYRSWLEDQYGGIENIEAQLIFAHNDAQYGNILRLIPTGASPLLLPANTHKQLVVIDFEYANANLIGLEFANHFTEWCYNYHDERKPYACTTACYPTPEEQDRFVRAYVRHQPLYPAPSPQITPQASPACSSLSVPTLSSFGRRPTSSITDFMLDARTPGTPTTLANTTNDEDVAKASEDAEVARLIHETRLWRLANSAQWVAWGIVQAKVPGMPDFATETVEESNHDQQVGDDGTADAKVDLFEKIVGDQPSQQMTDEVEKAEAEEEEEEEFDYLGYAHHRAMFFWGDAIQLGLIEKDDLPVEVQEKLKVVPY